MPGFKLILITFCSAIATTLAWQSYGDAARQVIAKWHPQLGWLAPSAAPIAYRARDTIGLAAQAAPSPGEHTISIAVDAMRQTVDRIAVTQEQITRNVEQLTARQERVTRNVDQLTAGQERMTREISKLQVVAQQSKPQPRPTAASARKPVPPSRSTVH